MGRKAVKWAVAGLIFASSHSAFAGISKIEFRYTSLTHLGFANSQTDAPFIANDTAQTLAGFLRSQGVTVVGFDENAFYPIQTQGDRDCEKWTLTIHHAELAAIRRNKWNDYKKIDRSKMPMGCQPKAHWLQYGFTQKALEIDRGFLISGVANRSIDYSRGGQRPSFSAIFGPSGSLTRWSMLPGERNYSRNFSTKIFIQVWPKPDEKGSQILVWAIPSSDGIDAAPGSSIGRDFHRQVDGTIESAAVRNVIAYLDQLSFGAKASLSDDPQATAPE